MRRSSWLNRSTAGGLTSTPDAPAGSAPACLAAPPRPVPLTRPAWTVRAPRQGGFLSLLYSIGSKPLQLWDKQVQNGHIKRLTDEDIQSSVLEVLGANVRAARPVRGGGGPNPAASPPLLGVHHVHLLPRGRERDAGHQDALPGDDHQEHAQVLQLRSHGTPSLFPAQVNAPSALTHATGRPS